MFKCLNLNTNILPKHSDIHNYSTRNNNKFTAPKCNVKKSEISVNFKSIKVWNKQVWNKQVWNKQVWNKLTADIRTSDSVNVFMDNLRNYFLSRY